MAENRVLQPRQRHQTDQVPNVRLPVSDSAQHRQTAHQQAADSSSEVPVSRKVAAQQEPQKLSRPKHFDPDLPVAEPPISSADIDELAKDAHQHCASSAAERLPQPACSPEVQAAAPTYAKIMQAQQKEETAGHQSGQQPQIPLSHLLCLWAIKLVLPHPVTQKVLKLGIPDPPDFQDIRTAEERRAQEQLES